MSLTTLIVVGICIFIFVLVVTLLTVNRAYKYQHTIDDYPVYNSQHHKDPS